MFKFQLADFSNKYSRIQSRTPIVHFDLHGVLLPISKINYNFISLLPLYMTEDGRNFFMQRRNLHRVFIHWNAFKKAAWSWILSKLGGWVGVIIEIYPIQSFFKNVWTCLTKPLINNCSNGVKDSHPLPPIFSRISKNLHIGKKCQKKNVIVSLLHVLW